MHFSTRIPRQAAQQGNVSFSKWALVGLTVMVVSLSSSLQAQMAPESFQNAAGGESGGVGDQWYWGTDGGTMHLDFGYPGLTYAEKPYNKIFITFPFKARVCLKGCGNGITSQNPGNLGKIKCRNDRRRCPSYVLRCNGNCLAHDCLLREVRVPGIGTWSYFGPIILENC